jgi:hypothetical protein
MKLSNHAEFLTAILAFTPEGNLTSVLVLPDRNWFTFSKEDFDYSVSSVEPNSLRRARV